MILHATLLRRLLAPVSTLTPLLTSSLIREFIYRYESQGSWFDDPRLCRNALDKAPGRVIQSDNVPNIPIFRHNATAVYSPAARNALSAFRTPLVLFSEESGQSSLSTLQKYPFDK